MEEMNGTEEIGQLQEVGARKPWQTPVVEELPMNEAEAAIHGSGGDFGIYS